MIYTLSKCDCIWACDINKGLPCINREGKEHHFVIPRNLVILFFSSFLHLSSFPCNLCFSHCFFSGVCMCGFSYLWFPARSVPQISDMLRYLHIFKSKEKKIIGSSNSGIGMPARNFTVEYGFQTFLSMAPLQSQSFIHGTRGLKNLIVMFAWWAIEIAVSLESSKYPTVMNSLWCTRALQCSLGNAIIGWIGW